MLVAFLAFAIIADTNTTEESPIESLTEIETEAVPSETEPATSELDTPTPTATEDPTPTPSPQPTTPTPVPTEVPTATLIGSSPLIKTIVIFICAGLFGVGFVSAIILCIIRRRQQKAKQNANIDIDQFMIPSGDGLELEEPLAPVH